MENIKRLGVSRLAWLAVLVVAAAAAAGTMSAKPVGHGGQAQASPSPSPTLEAEATTVDYSDFPDEADFDAHNSFSHASDGTRNHGHCVNYWKDRFGQLGMKGGKTTRLAARYGGIEEKGYTGTPNDDCDPTGYLQAVYDWYEAHPEARQDKVKPDKAELQEEKGKAKAAKAKKAKGGDHGNKGKGKGRNK